MRNEDNDNLGKLLPWQTIKQTFKGKWVELVDLKWDSNRPFPREARVKRHSSLRSALMSEIRKERMDPSATIFFLGGTESLISHSSLN